MLQKHYLWVFIAVVIAVPLSVYGLMTWYQDRFKPLPVLGPEGHTIAAFQFRNQQGNTVNLQDWNGKMVVANYFFTHCPSICTKMMYQLKRVQAYAGTEDLEIISFSVDPERDSVTRLQEYAAKHGILKNWHLLTGDKKSLYRLARNSFLIAATDGDGGPDDFIHSDKLVLIDTQKRIRGFYSGIDEAEVNQLIRDIKKLRSERRRAL
jgi:protein SCO1/2